VTSTTEAHAMTTTHPIHTGTRGSRAAFTLVELLVAIAIIALLIGIVVAALFGAQAFARRAAGTAQLQTIASGLDTFRNDIGYLPPLISALNATTDAIETPETLAAREDTRAKKRSTLAQEYRNARYMSEWSLAAYLLGEGDLNGDSDTNPADLDKDDGKQGLGIRNPGEFQVLVRVGGNPLGTFPLKVAVGPADSK